MVDLSTTYLGLPLKNPLVASASPLSQHVDVVKQLEEAGVSAVVMYSLFEEQIIADSLRLHRDLTQGTETFAEAITYLPDLSQYSDEHRYPFPASGCPSRSWTRNCRGSPSSASRCT